MTSPSPNFRTKAYLNNYQLWFAPECLALIVENPRKWHLIDEKILFLIKYILQDVVLDVNLSTF